MVYGEIRTCLESLRAKLNLSYSLLLNYLFKGIFACGGPYFFSAPKKVCKKVTAVHKKAKIFTLLRLAASPAKTAQRCMPTVLRTSCISLQIFNAFLCKAVFKLEMVTCYPESPNSSRW